MKIAIVEDSPDYLRNMREYLVSRGHDVLAVLVDEQSVETVAEAINGFSPDAVLLDHMLSEYGEKLGSKVASLLRQPRDKLISTSTTGHKPYCKWAFGLKDELSMGRVERAKKQLDDVLAKIGQPS